MVTKKGKLSKKSINDTKLNKKQKKFVDEYLVDLNGAQAAIRAGYSKNAAKVQAARLLTKDNLKVYLEKRMATREKRTEISQDMIIKELSHIAFDDIKNYLEFSTDIDGNIQTKIKDSSLIDTRAIQEVTIDKHGNFKFKLYEKDNALVMLGKHFGMFKENISLQADFVINPCAALQPQPQKLIEDTSSSDQEE